MEILRAFIHDVLTPLFGGPHLGLFLFVWFSAVFPLAPPEEAFTLLGGACIAAGVLAPFNGALVIIGGIIATDLTQYWMGRGVLGLLGKYHWGKRLVESRALRRARAAFARKGIWAIVSCRFFFGTRAPTYVAAGFLRYSFPRFAIVDSSIVLVHGAAFLVVGYIFSAQIDRIVEFTRALGVWALVALVMLIAMVLALKKLLRRNGNSLPAAVLPDPCAEPSSNSEQERL